MKLTSNFSSNCFGINPFKPAVESKMHIFSIMSLKHPIEWIYRLNGVCVHIVSVCVCVCFCQFSCSLCRVWGLSEEVQGSGSNEETSSKAYEHTHTHQDQ